MPVAVADLNQDGKPDLVVANDCNIGVTCNGGLIGVLLGNGDGTFQTAVPYGSGGYGPTSVSVADVNGDGKPDLVVVNEYASSSVTNVTVGVLLGNGDGTFQTVKNYDTGQYNPGWPNSVAVADVNGDGTLDLLVTNASCGWGGNCTSGTAFVLFGNGNGTFRMGIAYGSGGWGPTSVVAADVNRDGKPDLVVANTCASSSGPVFQNCSNGTVGVLLGNGNGTFQTAVPYGSGGNQPRSAAVADVNGDGKLDLLVANDCGNSNCAGTNGTVGVLLGNGDGTFQMAMAYDSGGIGIQSVAVGDVNKDTKLDLVVANACADGPCTDGTVGVLLGDGDGTFQTALTYGSGGWQPMSVAVADVNRDGKPDLLVANRCAINSNCGSSIPPAAYGSVGVLINTTLFDSVPPTTTAIPSPGPNAYGWNNTNVTVTLSATDNPGGSGVKEIQFALGGAQNTGWQTVAGNVASVTISTEGITVLSYFATDNAGNQETAKTLTVRIDKTPPVISGLPAPGCTIWPPNHKLVQVATVTATDALSGLAPSSFRVTGTSNDPTNERIVISGGPNQFIVQLGADKGQIYTLTAMASDLAGNTATAKATCTVPHDQGN
jgi:FG-GAP-like repeat